MLRQHRPHLRGEVELSETVDRFLETLRDGKVARLDDITLVGPGPCLRDREQVRDLVAHERLVALQVRLVDVEIRRLPKEPLEGGHADRGRRHRRRCGKRDRRANLTGAMTVDRDLEAPGVVLLESNDAIETISPAARRWLGELFDSTVATNDVPLVVASVAHEARRAGIGRADALASVRVPRRSGGWLRLDASLLEDGRRWRSFSVQRANPRWPTSSHACTA